MQATGDTGAWLRTTMGALALCGVPDEKYWPYNVADFDTDPSAFVYSVADNYEALRYVAHDPLGSDIAPDAVCRNVRSWIACGIPAMFGFWGFPSFEDSDAPGAHPLSLPRRAGDLGARSPRGRL